MLTKQDLSLIKLAMRTETGREFKSLQGSLTAEIKMTKIQILSTISELEDRIKNIETNQGNDHKLLKSLQNSIKKLRVDLTKTTDFFGKADLSTRAKVNKTRQELGLQEVAFAY